MRLPHDSRRYRWWVALVSALGALVLRALGATWRVRLDGPDPWAGGAPFVGAVWHRGMLIAAYHWRGRGAAVPVSRSRDGDLISAVLVRLGFREGPRGSSSQGGTEVLRSSVRLLRSGTVVGVLPDGPRGPALALKPGVVAMARSAGVPLVPVGVAARPALRFGSWDRALLPLPFARVVCRYGPAFRVPKSTAGAELEGVRSRVEAALTAVTRECDAALGLPEEARSPDALPERAPRER